MAKSQWFAAMVPVTLREPVPHSNFLAPGKTEPQAPISAAKRRFQLGEELVSGREVVREDERIAADEGDELILGQLAPVLGLDR